MHYLPLDSTDSWIIQEKAVYSFQHTPPLCSQLHHRRVSGLYSQVSWDQSNDPDVILLCLWPQATDFQIEQYTSGYQELFPSARIILADAFSTTTSYSNAADDYNAVLSKLVDANCSSITTSTSAWTKHQQESVPRGPSVLLHLFGTCGAANACTILRGFRLRTGGPLNVGAIVADTEPSSSLIAVLTSPQPVSSALLSFLLAFWMRLQAFVLFWPPEQSHIHHDLNNSGLLPEDVRKCFVFAQRGLMLTWLNHSLQQAHTWNTAAANSGLYNEEQHVRREHLRRSSIDQKGRWSNDQERYWSSIQSVWEGR